MEDPDKALTISPQAYIIRGHPAFAIPENHRNGGQQAHTETRTAEIARASECKQTVAQWPRSGRFSSRSGLIGYRGGYAAAARLPRPDAAAAAAHRGFREGKEFAILS